MDISVIKNKIKESFTSKNIVIDDLLYEKILDKIANYVKALSSMSNELISEEYLVYEISKIDYFRVGDFNKEIDSNLIYMGKPLIEEYNNADRPKSISTYALKDNKFVSVIVLFNSKEILHNGEMINIPGIDLDNDLELTRELYLSLTKYLGSTLIKHQDLKKLSFEGVDYQDGVNILNKVILNGITNGEEDYYEGFTTYEFNQRDNKIIKYDYLSNLMNEYIVDLLLNNNINDNIINKLSNKYGKEVFITKYIINSRKLLKEMERIKIKEYSLIHYIEINRNDNDYESSIENYLNIGEFIRPITKEQCYDFYSKYIK